jgi:hypothetical protein
MGIGACQAVKHGTRTWIERLARTGFVAKGVVYLILGFLGLRAALGGGAVASTRRALTGILQAPFGSALLAVLALGLAWYSGWRFIEAVADANGKGSEPKGLGARAIYLTSGVIYAALALDVIAILLSWDNDTGQVRSFAGRFLRGPFALGAGIGLVAYGLYQLWKGAVGKLSGQLNEGAARREAGRWVIAISRLGLAGRGLVFAVVGVWMLWHPWDAPEVASGSGGAAGSLRLIERLPEGDLFLACASIALVAYGAYQLVHSRYRRIEVPT